MQTADVILLLLGLMLGAWGASLVLRALVVRLAGVRRVWPISRMITERSPFVTAHAEMGAARFAATVVGGSAAVAIGMWCLTLRPNLPAERGYQQADLFAGAMGGLLLAFSGGALVLGTFADRAQGRRRCPKCWYDMAALSTNVCPECGHAARHEREFFRTRRSKGMLWLAAALLLASAIPGRVAAIRRGGLLAATPTPVLIAVYERLPGNWVSPSGAWGSGNPGEGPLADRMRVAPGWQREWLRSRVRTRLMEEQDADEFLKDINLWEQFEVPRETLASPAERAFRGILVGSCERHLNAMIEELADPAAAGSAAGAMGKAGRLLRWVRANLGPDAAWFSPKALALIERFATDPDALVATDAVALCGTLHEDALVRVVTHLCARVAAQQTGPGERAIAAQLGMVCRDDDRARAVWIERASDPSLAGRAALIARVGQYCVPRIGASVIEGWRMGVDPEVRGAGWFLLAAKHQESTVLSTPPTCAELLGELRTNRPGLGWLLFAASRLRCDSPKLTEFVLAGLRSPVARERRAAIVCGGELRIMAPEAREPLLAALADQALDETARHFGNLWARELGLATGTLPGEAGPSDGTVTETLERPGGR